MGSLENVSESTLRDWLEHVEGKAATESLMMALAYANGVEAGDIAAWFGVGEERVRSVVEVLEADPPAVAVAEWEGVDFAALGDQWGLGRETIVEWFAALESRPVEEAADIVHRYGQREAGPLLSHPTARVSFVNYEAVEARGWSVDDEDLFEKASDADLAPEEYGRFVVEPDETILEAAENRGYSWPYACRGGACANCAVLVVEGDVAMPGQTVLTEEQVRRVNGRLACVGVPVTEELKLVMNVQHLDAFEDLRLPSPASQADLSL